MSDPRQQFPELTKVVDEFKAAFGAVKVKFAEENGVTRGARSTPVSFPMVKYEHPSVYMDEWKATTKALQQRKGTK